VLLVACVYLNQPAPPVATAENAPKVAKFLASDQFTSLDKPKKTQYIEQISRDPEVRRAVWSQHDNLSEQERNNLHKNMRDGFRQQMHERMNKYFALKTPEEKKQMLDEVIAEMQKRAENQQPRSRPATSNRPASTASANRPSREERRKARIEQSSPQDRAQRRQFFRDMIARAKELGIELPHHRHRH
jgi:hypothetical protein